MNISYKTIENKNELESFVKHLKKEKTIAVDLEADSMYHFKEKVCLIQMATEKTGIMIDPLQVKDLSPLKPVFSNTRITKVFHGADYDVRSLYRDFRIDIHNLFDTELAFRFLGMKETGLEAVLKKKLSIRLDKKYQKKDWSQRPLPKKMKDYAAKDVVYLLTLAKICKKELEKKGRLLWVLEECFYLSRVRPAVLDEKPLFMKFKGAGRLDSKSLTVLESLLTFRRRIAQAKDRPLFKIFSNTSIMKIATGQPTTLEQLKNLNVLSQKQIKRYGGPLVETVNNALKTPVDKLCKYPEKKAPVFSGIVHERIKALKIWRSEKAGQLEMDPGILCNNATIAAIAETNPFDQKSFKKIKEMKKWQIKEFGKEIIQVLNRVNH